MLLVYERKDTLRRILKLEQKTSRICQEIITSWIVFLETLFLNKMETRHGKWSMSLRMGERMKVHFPFPRRGNACEVAFTIDQFLCKHNLWLRNL